MNATTAKAEYRAAVKALDEKYAALNQAGVAAAPELVAEESARVERAKAAYDASKKA